MKVLTGISASPGIVIGKAFLYLDDAIKTPHYSIEKTDLDREYERYMEAVEKAEKEIEHLRKKASSEMGKEEARFLDAHILMLQDPEVKREIKEELEKTLMNVESVLLRITQKNIDILQRSMDTYLRERAIDLHDVSKRVMDHLMYRNRVSLADLQEDVILVSHNLMPSDAMVMDKRLVKGIALDAGGKTSHTAILARAFEIPAVLGLSEVTVHVKNGENIIIDGNAGRVIINPDISTLEKYNEYSKEWQKREVRLLTLNELSAETKDGKTISLQANIEFPEETDSVIAHGAEGIGLFRSEFLFLQRNAVFSEEFQFKIYKKVLKAMGNKSVTIRTLDIGGDKTIPEYGEIDEKNPLLGWRAIRFCLLNRDFFKIQMRAILRASVYGNIKIMFPMISGVEELNEACALFEEAKHECDKNGYPYNKDIETGIMIEVPSAALTSDILAKKVKFFSIGTNDLIQYTIAVDRGNEKVAYLYEPFHPAVLRLIKTVIDNAHAVGVPVGMCGEMAGDPLATVILLGLGLDVFSMSAFGIPEVKQIVRTVSMEEAEELVGEILDMTSYREIDRLVKGWMHARFDIFKN